MSGAGEFEVALRCYQAGDLVGAELACRRVLKSSRKHAGALQLLGAVCLKKGRSEQAVKLMTEAVRADRTNASGYVNLGEVYRGLGRFDRAVAAYRQALKVDPKRPEAHCNLGNALAAQGHPEAALEAFGRALEIDPGLAVAHYSKANLLAEQGDFDAAEAAYRQALALDPKLADAHYNLGNLLSGRNLQAAAAEAYERAVALKPDFAPGFYNLGNARRRLGQWQAAGAAYAKALALDPSLSGAELYLGTAAKLDGRLLDARRHLEVAVAQAPDSAEAQTELAHIDLLEQDIEGAIEGFERSAALDPDFAWAEIGLATALAEAGRSQEAHQATLRAVEKRRSYERPCRAALPEGRVLVLKGVEDRHFSLMPNDEVELLAGMNNADDHFDLQRFRVTSYYLDGLEPGREARGLPDCDVIFNAISDPDAMPNSLAAAARLAAAVEVPVINKPKDIALTARDETYRLFQGLDGIFMPKMARLKDPPRETAGVEALLEAEGIAPPLLVRRTGTHTGASMEKMDNAVQLADYWAASAGGEFYITAFHDFARRDGDYAKFRVFFVDGRILTSQLFISPEWYVRASGPVLERMLRSDFKMKESEAFMSDPERYLGTEAWHALSALRDRLPLDYFGVDFTRLPDGRLMVFEANAVMRIPYLDTVEFAFRKPYIVALQAALSDLLAARMGAAGRDR